MSSRSPFPPLPADFYDRDVVQVAQDLLGKLLVRRTTRGLCFGRLVEVEAYLAEGDSACHAYRGRTRKNASMFGPPGRLYVYPIHGRWCMNAVTEPAGVPSAVLIRAVEPLGGLVQMQVRRGSARPLDLTRGPARLCQALDVDRRLDGWPLMCGRRIWLANDPKGATFTQVSSSRIGVTSNHEAQLRYFVAGNPFVSGRR